MKLRRQLPGYSPITTRAVWRAATSGFRPTNEALDDLTMRLAREYAAKTAMLLGSGTQALQVALQLARQAVGASTVALPAFTCFDVASAAVAVGARIALYDVEPDTLAPDLDSLRRVLERGARVVVLTPLYGYPVAWECIEALLAPYGALPIEDAAQGHGAKWRGRPVGSFGSISVLSFGRGKGWTGGAGGALLLRRAAAGDHSTDLRLSRQSPTNELRVLFQLAAHWALGRPSLYSLPAAMPWLGLGETIYRDAAPPRAMSRSACACLAELREAAEREATARRRNALALIAGVEAGTPVRFVRPLGQAVPGFLRLPLRLAHGLQGFADPARARRLGIVPSYPRVLAAVPQVRPHLATVDDSWPGAAELARTLFTAPTHSLLSADECDELVLLLRGYRG